MADRRCGGGGRLRDDQFDVDAEFHAPVAIVGVQQFLAWLQRQHGFTVANVRSAVLFRIAGLSVGLSAGVFVVAGVRGFTVAWRWLVRRRHAAAAGLAEPVCAGQCRRIGRIEGAVRCEWRPGDGGLPRLARRRRHGRSAGRIGAAPGSGDHGGRGRRVGHGEHRWHVRQRGHRRSARKPRPRRRPRHD
ncbi:MAG TPA: hypothetical protein VF851_01545 [Steroidobacteraceae bacterium]